MKKLLWFILAVGIITALVFIFSGRMQVNACGGERHTDWSRWSDWRKGECRLREEVKQECGEADGVRVVTRQRICRWFAGCGQNVCKPEEVQRQRRLERCVVDLGECEKPKEPKENKFSEDTRCHDPKPPAITWLNITDGSPANDWHPQATWSAEGGDTIEVKFSDDPDDLKWQFTMENDGHESLGFEHNTGLLGMVDYCYQFRTVNGCKNGDWTDTVCAFN